MRLMNIGGRLTLATTQEWGVDVAQASSGAYGPDPQSVFDVWDDFRSWAHDAQLPAADVSLDSERVMAPVPQPRQVFALALNYADHSAEAGRPLPTSPIVFTKFPTCLAGPYDDVPLPQGNVDWEVELVVVIGRSAFQVAEADAWEHVAGLTAGQDLSERVLQFSASVPQLALAKSLPGFGPFGPALVTIDEFENPDDLALECCVNGIRMQSSRTSHMIFSVPNIVSQISRTCRLLPGDLIFTGTPAGVGARQDPPQYLQDGDVVESHIEGIGELRNVVRDRIGVPADAAHEGDRGR